MYVDAVQLPENGDVRVVPGASEQPNPPEEVVMAATSPTQSANQQATSTLQMSVSATGFTIARAGTQESVTLSPAEAQQVQIFLQSAASVPQQLATAVPGS